MKTLKRKKLISAFRVARKYVESKNLSKNYETNLLTTAKKCKYLTSEYINKYLKDRLNKVDTATAKSNRTIILILCKWAYENNILKNLPKNILKIKVKRKPTKAWTIDECKMLVAKTYELDNQKTKKGCSLGLFLRCWILLAYESGARFGDVFSFKTENIDKNILRWTQSKTGDPLTKILSDQLIDNIKHITTHPKAQSSDSILGWVVRRRQAFRIMEKFLKHCGLEGSGKFLRRSGATHLENKTPGSAKLHLGHRTSGSAEKHYIDYAQIERSIPIVPSLF